MRNRFAGVCGRCGERVAAGAGHALKVGAKWHVFHEDGVCQARKKEEIKLDSYQQRIMDAVLTGVSGPHILVDAKAGTGKTTMQAFSLGRLYERDSSLNIICLPFGSEDAERLRKKLPAGVSALTTHSFCMGVLTKAYPGAKLSFSKVTTLLDMIVSGEHEDDRGLVTSLLSKVQADAVRMGDHEAYAALVESYSLAIPADAFSRIFGYVDAMLREGADVKKHGFTFDDALYMVATQNLPLPSYDFVGVDECQDYNQCQLNLIGRLIDSGARIMAVGDPYQSLYAFRGARHDSFERIRAMLADSERGVSSLPMPRCRRCAKNIIRYAQEVVSGIEALDDAPAGSVSIGMLAAELPSAVTAGDMVICRTNAPLVRLAWSFIQDGRRFYMRGGKAEAGLLNWYIDIWSSGSDDVMAMIAGADRWLAERAANTSPYKMAEHQGRLEVIKVIGERVLTVKDLKKQIRRIFGEPTDKTDCVILSTIHRAKGSEAKRVYHLQPQLCPHPKAKTEEEKAQERNALYVARTRAALEYIETAGELAATGVGESS